MGWPFGSMTMVWMNFTAGYPNGRCIEWVGKSRSCQFMAIVPDRQMSVVKSALDRFARYKVLNQSLLNDTLFWAELHATTRL